MWNTLLFYSLLLFFLFGLCNDSQKLARNGFRYIIFISVFLVWVALSFLVSSIAKNFSYLDTTHWIRCKSVLLHVCIDIATRPLRNLLILSPPSVHNSQSQHSQRAWLTNELYFHLFVWLAFPIWTIRVHLEFWLARSLLCFPEDYHLWLWYKCVIDQEWVNTPRYWSINIPEKITRFWLAEVECILM